MHGSEILLINPSHRRKGKHKRKHSHRFSRVRRNPSLRGLTGRFMPTLSAGLIGGVGGVANDALFGFGAKWLPTALTTGIARHAVKVASAVAIGALGGMVLKGKGAALAAGAASCAVRDALREQLVTAFPSLPLGDYDPNLLGYDNSAEPLGEYMPGMAGFAEVGLGEYMPG